MKYRCSKMGISPVEFRKSKPSDIIDILQIEDAVNQKMEHEREVQNKINQMQGKW